SATVPPDSSHPAAHRLLRPSTLPAPPPSFPHSAPHRSPPACPASLPAFSDNSSPGSPAHSVPGMSTAHLHTPPPPLPDSSSPAPRSTHAQSALAETPSWSGSIPIPPVSTLHHSAAADALASFLRLSPSLPAAELDIPGTASLF